MYSHPSIDTTLFVSLVYFKVTCSKIDQQKKMERGSNASRRYWYFKVTEYFCYFEGNTVKYVCVVVRAMRSPATTKEMADQGLPK